jgi:thiamine-monophosphate kinase
MSSPDRRGEFELIARYFAPLASGEAGAFGLLDDAAVIAHGPGREIVVTTDALVGGIHFIGDESARDIARKALRVNLSDLAAMGAVPRAYSLALALPDTVDDDWVADFSAGLGDDQATFGIGLIGGDTVATTGPAVVAITAYGECERGRAIRRAGARPGDRLYVSGTIGDAAFGLGVLKGALAVDGGEGLAARYRLPEPRTALGPRLVDLANAMIDVSDGLVADLGHIVAASAVGATVRAGAVPLSPAGQGLVVADPCHLAAAITGGDDYELLFAVSAGRDGEVAALAAELGIAITAIGEIEREAGVRVVGDDGRPIIVGDGGYRHF